MTKEPINMPLLRCVVCNQAQAVVVYHIGNGPHELRINLPTCHRCGELVTKTGLEKLIGLKPEKNVPVPWDGFQKKFNREATR